MIKMMDRPYCLNELRDLEQDLHSKFRLGNVFAEHYPCLHRYRVKRGGRKEQFILDVSSTFSSEQSGKRSKKKEAEQKEGSQMDDQTCSICFKLRTSAENPPVSVINEMKERDGNATIPLDVEYIKLKHDFYRWLFQHDFQ